MSGNRLESICNCFVLILDVVWKTFRERWTLQTFGERERGSRKSLLVARHDDDDDGIYIYIYIYI